jgi:hypothetical protein
MVSEFSRLDEMGDGEQGTKHYADTADDDVGDAQEGVLAAHDGSRRDYDGFCTAVFSYVKICLVVLDWG